MAKRRQLGLFGNGQRNGPLKLGKGSCVWALVDPSDTRTPADKSFTAPKAWRLATVHAYGPPFKRMWVKLRRPIGGQDLEAATRLSTSATKPKTHGAGMSAAEFERRAGPMGRYQLGSCRIPALRGESQRSKRKR